MWQGSYFVTIFQKCNLLRNNTFRLCSVWFLPLAIFKQEVKQTISHCNRIPGVAGRNGRHSTLGNPVFFYYEFKIVDL